MKERLICVELKTELLDAPQPLKFGRVNQPHHQFAFVVEKKGAEPLSGASEIEWVELGSLRTRPFLRAGQ